LYLDVSFHKGVLNVFPECLDTGPSNNENAHPFENENDNGRNDVSQGV
jgi:hypothetical protein